MTKITKKLWQFLTVISLSALLICDYSWLTPSVAQGIFVSEQQENLNISPEKSQLGNELAVIAQTPTEPKPEPTDKKSKPDIETPQNEETKGFPVVLDGKTLFTVEEDGRTTTAEQRAKLATEEIERIARDYTISLDSFELQDFEEVIIITAQGDIVFGVTNDDAKAANQPLEGLASQYFQTIKDAILEYRQERTARSLGTDIILSLILLVVLVVLIVLLYKAASITRSRFQAWRRRVRPIRIQRLELSSVETEIKLINGLISFIRLIVLLALIYTYFSTIFRIFPQTRRFGEQFRKPVYDAFKWAGKGFVDFLPNLFIIILTIVITYYLIRFCSLFFKAIDREIITLPGFDQDWAKPTNKIVVILIIAGALAVIVPYLPVYNSPAFQGISLLVGALITFGGASTVANLVGGTVIIYTRAYRLGDLIKTEEHFGYVHEKTILSTRIRTLTGEIVTIPNANLISTSIINYNAIKRELNIPLMIRTSITLGYDVPWRKVYQTLIDAAHATENILEEPAPYVLQTSLEDFYISYELRAYIDLLERRLLTLSKLHENIQDKCNEVGIEILSPHYSAIRDGNQNTIPENYLPSDYVPPGFNINPLGQVFNNVQHPAQDKGSSKSSD
ncbi:MAG: mechanosensitive ion channel family protein [Xenococcus sp. MO_188.B8]|nr:mechanosensitive ion channel family protein [Xenococcus sp. MO_188.B8]